ncbi:biotin biosynthesis protein BioC [bacterium BMS3Bbin02]|nr:biotin biosynthesis protein BioC [bacterium BMS3Bbin02]
MNHVNLSSLARGYDYRPMSDAARRRAQEAVVERTQPIRVALDIGGGRGSHAAVWADANVFAIVLDPSTAMLAHVPEAVHRVCGTAQAIPFAAATVDLVYFHLSIHYGNWRLSLDEACRVMARRGQGLIYTLGERHHRQSFLNHWFPSVGRVDAGRFPNPADIVSHLGRLGCDVEFSEIDEIVRTTPARFRCSVRAGYVSTLQFVSNDELEQGLAAFDREYVEGDSVEYVLALDRIAWSAPDTMSGSVGS